MQNRFEPRVLNMLQAKRLELTFLNQFFFPKQFPIAYKSAILFCAMHAGIKMDASWYAQWAFV